MLSTVMSEPSQLTCPSCTVTVLPLTVALVTLPQVAGWCDVQEVIPLPVGRRPVRPLRPFCAMNPKTVATSRGHVPRRGHAAGNDGAAITCGDALANFPGRADDMGARQD